MKKGVNKVTIIGNIGRDPECRYLPKGDAVTRIAVATSETWKDKATGQEQQKTEWHSIIMYKKLAEIAAQYLKKGSKVYIEGSLRTRKWKDHQGEDKYSTEIVATEMQMLDSRQSGQQQSQPQNQQRPQQQATQPKQQRPQQQQGQNSQPQFDDFDDDIPF